MKEIFSIAGISRQAYYKASFQSEKDSVLWQRLLELLIEYRKDQPRSSARKIHRALRITAVGINRFEKYVSSQGLSIKRASDNMMALNNYNALQMSFKNRNQNWFKNLIHHSDKESQYGANLYTSLLLEANIRISMANICYLNPYAERINGIIKNDYLIAYKIDNLEDLKKALSRSVKLYNNYPHGKLNLKSPNEFENYLKELSSSECLVMKLYDFSK